MERLNKILSSDYEYTFCETCPDYGEPNGCNRLGNECEQYRMYTELIHLADLVMQEHDLAKADAHKFRLKNRANAEALHNRNAMCDKITKERDAAVADIEKLLSIHQICGYCKRYYEDNDMRNSQRCQRTRCLQRTMARNGQGGHTMTPTPDAIRRAIRVPIIMIRDKAYPDSGERAVGSDVHDALLIGEDGQLHYYNLQNGEGSGLNRDYQFVGIEDEWFPRVEMVTVDEFLARHNSNGWTPITEQIPQGDCLVYDANTGRVLYAYGGEWDAGDWDVTHWRELPLGPEEDV